jgi:DMSO/TMAO reductase YedYZ molybdopterin-dependent catalytic subunit
MVGVDLDKLQPEAAPTPQGLPAGIIVSSDTRRDNRVPPGQSRTRKWPVLDASGPPRIDLDAWRFRMWGGVNREVDLSWAEFQQLPRVKVFADFHCVTRWSRLGNVWEGVSTRHLLKLANGIKQDTKFVLVYGYDHGWTTNLPVDEFASEDALVAVTHDGVPLAPEHGAPARLVVPKLYAWKSAKWIGGLEFLNEDTAGFWERNGYHMNGNPWTEERYSWT